MRLLFLGPPGAGKGTQSKLLAQKFGLFHVAPGDIFRQEVKAGSPLGRVVEEYMARGELVPDDVTIKVMEKQLTSAKAEKGFMLDGFPRNISQAIALDEVLTKNGVKLDLVINLTVPENELIRRSKTRRVCVGCGKPYNIKSEPPRKPGKCDVCGSKLTIRKDDAEETVRSRLRVYDEATSPLKEFYESRGLLETVDGNAGVDVVASRIVSVLSKRGML
jgi:adenylate kinase